MLYGFFFCDVGESAMSERVEKKVDVFTNVDDEVLHFFTNER